MENPQENYILETIHQVIANLVCTFDLKNNYLYNDDRWSVILSDMDFAVCIMYHTTLQSTPVQVVFGCNMILNTPFIADWVAIRKHKQ